MPKLCAHVNKFQLKIQITQQLLVQIMLLLYRITLTTSRTLRRRQQLMPAKAMKSNRVNVIICANDCRHISSFAL